MKKLLIGVSTLVFAVTSPLHEAYSSLQEYKDAYSRGDMKKATEIRRRMGSGTYNKAREFQKAFDAQKAAAEAKQKAEAAARQRAAEESRKRAEAEEKQRAAQKLQIPQKVKVFFKQGMDKTAVTQLLYSIMLDSPGKFIAKLDFSDGEKFEEQYRKVFPIIKEYFQDEKLFTAFRYATADILISELYEEVAVIQGYVSRNSEGQVLGIHKDRLKVKDLCAYALLKVFCPAALQHEPIVLYRPPTAASYTTQQTALEQQDSSDSCISFHEFTKELDEKLSDNSDLPISSDEYYD